MALVQSNASEPRAFSVGPLKMQLINITLASGDTSAAVVCDGLSLVKFVTVSGFVQTAAPSYSGNTATLTVVDPAATRMGQVIAYGI